MKDAAEAGQHALEVGLEALGRFRVERAYEAGRMERAAHVGVVDVGGVRDAREHVARGASQEVVVGAGVGEQGTRTDSARTAALERLQHARGVVSLPAEKMNHAANLTKLLRGPRGGTNLVDSLVHMP